MTKINKVNLLFNILFFIFGLIVISIFVSVRPRKKISIRRSKYKQLKNLIDKNITVNEEIENLFNKFNTGVSLKIYQIIRWSIFIISVLIYGISLIFQAISPIILIIVLVVFLVTSPKEKILQFKSPFILLLESIDKEKKNEYNLEIFRAISQLKNIIITKKNSPTSSDFILEQLKMFTNKTRPIFNQFLYFWSLGQKDEAVNYFNTSIGTTEAEELSDLFMKIDELDPIELKDQLTLYQEKITQQRETAKLKAYENKSYVVYGIVATSVSIIALNFIIIALYIDQMRLLQYAL